MRGGSCSTSGPTSREACRALGARASRAARASFSRTSATARTACRTSPSTATTCSRSATAKGRRSALRSPACSTSSSTIPPPTIATPCSSEARRWLALSAVRRPRAVPAVCARRPGRPSPSSPPRSTSPLEELGVLVEAGRGGRGGEPRAGPRCQARRLRRRLPLALHRPPAVEQGEGGQRRSASSSTRSTPSRRRAGSTVPALLEVNLSGEDIEVGGRPGGDRRLARAVPGDPRADDDAAARGRPGDVAAVLPAARASSPPSTGWPSSRWARRRTGASRSRRARR